MQHGRRWHSGDLRKGRYSKPGQIYLLTTVTLGRRRIFLNCDAACCVTQSLRCIHQRRMASTIAFVVMPDHLHWLMQLGDDASLSRTMHSLKSYSAKRIRQMTGIYGPVWHCGYHDRAVRREGHLRALARYVVANPLRAGLVDDIGKYPHWDAVWL